MNRLKLWLVLKGAKWMLKDLLTLKWLEGRRTYVGAAIIAILTFLKIIGVVDEKTYTEVVGFLTAIGLVTAAVHRNPSP